MTTGSSVSPSGEAAWRIHRLMARFIGGGYLAYALVCLPEIRADLRITASWWPPLAVVLSFGPGWLLWTMSFGRFRSRLSTLVPMLCAGGYLTAIASWFVAWNGDHVASERGTWLVLFPGLASLAVVLARGPWWTANLYLLIVSPLAMVASTLGRAPHFGQWPAFGDVAYSIMFSGVFVWAAIAALRTGDLWDEARENAAQVEAEAAAAAAREAERELHKLLVHDRVLVVLQEVRPGPNPRLVPYARTALADMAATDGDDLPNVDLLATLRSTAIGISPDVMVSVATAVDSLPVPAAVVSGIVDAVAEAIRNAVRHAGPKASTTLLGEWDGRGVRLVVADNGCGFDPAAVAADRMGLRFSIERRMAAVGGVAAVDSAPRCGTRIRLQWPRD
jgi:signal transduction histidine kinase